MLGSSLKPLDFETLDFRFCSILAPIVCRYTVTLGIVLTVYSMQRYLPDHLGLHTLKARCQFLRACPVSFMEAIIPFLISLFFFGCPAGAASCGNSRAIVGWGIEISGRDTLPCQIRDSLSMVAKEIIENNGLARFLSPVYGLPVIHGIKKAGPALRGYSQSGCPDPKRILYDSAQCLIGTFRGSVDKFSSLYPEKIAYDTLRDVAGCDSVIMTYYITPVPQYAYVYDTSRPAVDVCYGYTIEGTVFNNFRTIVFHQDTAIYSNTGLLQNRCGGGFEEVTADHYHVISPKPKIYVRDTAVCMNDVWKGLTLTKDTTILVTGAYTATGCDSIIWSYQVTIVNPIVDSVYKDTSICTGMLYRGWRADTDTAFADTVIIPSSCGNAIHFIFTQARVIRPIPFTLGSDTTICPNSAIMLQGPAGAAHYGWSDGTHSQDLFVSDSGTYDLTVTAPNGCLSLDSMHVHIFPSESFLFPPDSVLCKGDTLQLISDGGNRYSWDPPIGLSCVNCASPLASPDTTTVYHLVIQGICLEKDHAIQITVDAPEVSVKKEYKIYRGEQVQLHANGQGDISWKKDLTLSCTLCTDPIASPQTTTLYDVQATEGNCSASAETQVDVEEGFYFYVPTAFSPNGDGNNDRFGPKTNLLGKYEMFVYNRWGRLVFHSSNVNDTWDGTWKGRYASVGAYVYVFRYQDPDGKWRINKGSVTLIR